jgi:hypothetical protein
MLLYKCLVKSSYINAWVRGMLVTRGRVTLGGRIVIIGLTNSALGYRIEAPKGTLILEH